MSLAPVKRKKTFIVRNAKAIIGVICLVLVLPVLIVARSSVVTLFSQAATYPANIVVDASQSQATLKRPWEGLSQGGESETNGTLLSLAPVTSQIKILSPRYIRIDHVFDRPYESRVQEIAASGALPFIALSYFPPDVASSDIGSVSSWPAWQEHVTKLIEHVSGRNGLNLSGVYYEVWNEPDGEGFGNFNIGTGKDYFTLYQKTVAAALSAQNVNDFKIGGPALADLRRCTDGLLFVCNKFWLDQFLNLAASSKTRLDFISWHRYSTKISDFDEDVNFINSQYTKYNTLAPAEKIITEWGSDPAPSPIHNTIFDAAHLVAASKAFLGHTDLSTKFEIRDGPNANGNGWGILTYAGEKKPAFAALELLNKMRSERVLLSGEGSYVTGFASRDSGGLSVVLVNYDSASSYTEQVPVKIINLYPGRYRLTKYEINSAYPLGHDETSTETLPKGVYATQETMLPNSIVLYDFQLTGLLNN